MRAATLVLILAPTLILATTPAVSGATGPCAVPDFIGGGTQLVTAPPGRWLQVSFHVDAPASETLWAGVAWHAATTAVTDPLYYGYAAERAAAIGFVEDASGAQPTGPFAFVMFPYGATIEVGDANVHLAEQDSDVCGASASGANPSLIAGSYTLTVLAASDLENGAGAFLPASYVIDAVRTGPATPISESTLTCAVDAHAAVLGMSSFAMADCAQTLPASGRAYHGVFSGRFTDATHDVRWDPAAGATRIVGFFDGRIEGAGDAKLLVPKYVTPIGNPLYLPLPLTPAALTSDSGVFGVHADIG